MLKLVIPACSNSSFPHASGGNQKTIKHPGNNEEKYGGNHTSHTSAHELTAAAAPFRA